jgi:predicted S18 family serine protease
MKKILAAVLLLMVFASPAFAASKRHPHYNHHLDHQQHHHQHHPHPHHA